MPLRNDQPLNRIDRRILRRRNQAGGDLPKPPPATPGVWSGAFLTYDSAAELHDWCLKNIAPRITPGLGALVEPGEYHTTIVASRRPTGYGGHGIFPEPLRARDDEPYVWDLFGREANRRMLVLRIEQDTFREWHTQALERGASYDFPDYVPHVTLATGLPDNFDYSLLGNYTGALVYRFEEVKPFDPGFYSENDEEKEESKVEKTRISKITARLKERGVLCQQSSTSKQVKSLPS